MPKKLYTKKKNHICSMKGCGNRNTHLFCRSEDFMGALYLCDTCIKDMYESAFKEEESTTSKNNSSET